MATYRTIDHAEAQQLLDAGTATVIDVRTPGEYAQLGHIPGALLVPVDLVASAPAILPEDPGQVLVYCEHGVRSRAASELLAAAGIDQVLNLAGGLAGTNHAAVHAHSDRPANGSVAGHPAAGRGDVR